MMGFFYRPDFGITNSYAGTYNLVVFFNITIKNFIKNKTVK